MAGQNGPFGFDPEDFDRFTREAGEGLRQVFGRAFSEPGAANVFSMFVDGSTSSRSTSSRPTPTPKTAGEAGSGVWAVFVVDEPGGARVEQVFATEIDALRANQYNTDPKRRVRFLPYGIAVSVLEGAALESIDPDDGTDSRRS